MGCIDCTLTKDKNLAVLQQSAICLSIQRDLSPPPYLMTRLLKVLSLRPGSCKPTGMLDAFILLWAFASIYETALGGVAASDAPHTSK